MLKIKWGVSCTPTLASTLRYFAIIGTTGLQDTIFQKFTFETLDTSKIQDTKKIFKKLLKNFYLIKFYYVSGFM